jgi:hypothetical protein
VGRQTYTYETSGGCGNGRSAECTTTHTLYAPGTCAPTVLIEWSGGGTSTREGHLRGSDPAARRWLLAKAGTRLRTDAAEDLLAHPPPAGGPVRWVQGAPTTPRNSWFERPCEGSSWSPGPEDTCVGIFTGEQVTRRRIDPVVAGFELHVYANDWRNRRVFLVLHDTASGRHALVAKTMVPSFTTPPTELPQVVGHTRDGVVLAQATMDVPQQLHWIRTDGSHQSRLVQGRPTPQGDGWIDEQDRSKSWSDLFRDAETPARPQ